MSAEDIKAKVVSLASDVSGMSEEDIRTSGYLCNVMEYEVYLQLLPALEAFFHIKYDMRKYEVDSIGGLCRLTEDMILVPATNP